MTKDKLIKAIVVASLVAALSFSRVLHILFKPSQELWFMSLQPSESFLYRAQIELIFLVEPDVGFEMRPGDVESSTVVRALRAGNDEIVRRIFPHVPAEHKLRCFELLETQIDNKVLYKELKPAS